MPSYINILHKFPFTALMERHGHPAQPQCRADHMRRSGWNRDLTCARGTRTLMKSKQFLHTADNGVIHFRSLSVELISFCFYGLSAPLLRDGVLTFLFMT